MDWNISGKVNVNARIGKHTTMAFRYAGAVKRPRAGEDDSALRAAMSPRDELIAKASTGVLSLLRKMPPEGVDATKWNVYIDSGATELMVEDCITTIVDGGGAADDLYQLLRDVGQKLHSRQATARRNKKVDDNLHGVTALTSQQWQEFASVILKAMADALTVAQTMLDTKLTGTTKHLVDEGIQAVTEAIEKVAQYLGSGQLSRKPPRKDKGARLPPPQKGAFDHLPPPNASHGGWIVVSTDGGVALLQLKKSGTAKCVSCCGPTPPFSQGIEETIVGISIDQECANIQFGSADMEESEEEAEMAIAGGMGGPKLTGRHEDKRIYAGCDVGRRAEGRAAAWEIVGKCNLAVTLHHGWSD